MSFLIFNFTFFPRNGSSGVHRNDLNVFKGGWRVDSTDKSTCCSFKSSVPRTHITSVIPSPRTQTPLASVGTSSWMHRQTWTSTINYKQYLLKIDFVFLDMYIYVCLCWYIQVSAGSLRIQKSVLDPLELELQLPVYCPRQMLRTEPRLTGRAMLSLSCWVPSLALVITFNTTDFDTAAWPEIDVLSFVLFCLLFYSWIDLVKLINIFMHPSLAISIDW